jgi:hypothetical protein
LKSDDGLPVNGTVSRPRSTSAAPQSIWISSLMSA